MLQPAPEQQAALNQLLAGQQDISSANYHRWLTPEEFADRFSVSPTDVDRIEAWLTGQGFSVSYKARARNWLSFSGTAQQVERTFHTRIHRYLIDGEEHYSNVADPAIPGALAGVASAMRGLNDFRLKPLYRQKPDYTAPGGAHYISPDDLASIYGLNGLYSAGIDGTGQKIAIVGQTDITLSDIAAFRSIFNLPPNVPQLVLHGSDPGVSSTDLPEAELDLEWSGAVARNATILYVYSTDVLSSLQYAVDQNLAPVISMSYGACESDDAGVLDSYRTTAQQAASQGISWLAASGDTGAAGCDSQTSKRATQGEAVSFPASIPEVTAVGGTEFNEGGTVYWNSINGVNQSSATGYIPEKAWNDTAADGTLTATGGGASNHFPAPVWQTGAGFPNTGYRDVPDVALTASADHDGFIVCVGTTNCPSATWMSRGAGSGYAVFGGTSASTPAFAGILTLLNHYLVAHGIQSTGGLGSANQTLYWLAQNSPSAFHDATVGDNVVPCGLGTANCSTGSFGFTAGTGYDQATGLGSVNAFNLVTAWSTAMLPAVTSISPATPTVSSTAQILTVAGTGFQLGLKVSLTSPSGVIASASGSTITAGTFQTTVALNAPGTWKIQAIDTDGRPSNVFSFTVNAPFAAPTVTVAAAASVTSSSAALTGTVNANGVATIAWLEYGTVSNLSGAAATVAQNIGQGTSPVAVGANLTGLAANTTYYFRTAASSSSGTSRSSILSFKTAPSSIGLPGTPSGLTPADGSINISVNPTLSWTQSTNATGYLVYFGAANPPTSFTTISGGNVTTYSPGQLAANSRYYWQVVASNSSGTASSPIISFTTAPVSMTSTRVGDLRSGGFILNKKGDGSTVGDTLIAFTGIPGGILTTDIPVTLPMMVGCAAVFCISRNEADDRRWARSRGEKLSFLFPTHKLAKIRRIRIAPQNCRCDSRCHRHVYRSHKYRSIGRINRSSACLGPY